MGDVPLMVQCSLCMQEVRGSIPRYIVFPIEDLSIKKEAR